PETPAAWKAARVANRIPHRIPPPMMPHPFLNGFHGVKLHALVGFGAGIPAWRFGDGMIRRCVQVAAAAGFVAFVGSISANGYAPGLPVRVKSHLRGVF
ncbi:hypothetical protein ACWCSH_47200, partial [Streptosporangium sp. NPDC001682]